MSNESYGSYELQPEWLDEFSWVSGRPGDEYVYCKLCQKDIGVHGRSSLRAHASGIKHSQLEKKFIRHRYRLPKKSLKGVIDRLRATSKSFTSFSASSASTSSSASSGNTKVKLEKEFKRKQKSVKVPLSRLSSASKPSTSRSVSSGVNNFFINAPNASTLPDVLQPFSNPQHMPMNNTFQREERSSFGESRNFAKEESSPLIIDEFFSRAQPECSNFDQMKQEFKKSIRDMFSQQNTMAETDISDVLGKYRRFFSSRSYSVIKGLLDRHKSSVKQLRNDTKKQLFDFLQRY